MKQFAYLLLVTAIAVNSGSSSALEKNQPGSFDTLFRRRSAEYSIWFAKVGEEKYRVNAENYKATEKGFISVCMDWLQGEDLLDDSTYITVVKKLMSDPRVLSVETAVQEGWDLIKQRFEGLTKTRRLQINNKAGPYFRLCGGG